MTIKKEFILPIIILLILGALCIYLPATYLEDFIFYRNLYSSGIQTTAVITNKGIIPRGNFVFAENTLPSGHHLFELEYTSLDNGKAQCYASVSKTVYDSYSTGGILEIIYTESDGKRCFQPETAYSLYILSLVIFGLGLLFPIIFLTAAYFIFGPFGQSGKPVKLSSEFVVSEEGLLCPECGRKMVEGYVPGVGGINWRIKNEPVGLPHMLTGLPGTVYWFKRPILHAYNCMDCAVITFKYNKN